MGSANPRLQRCVQGRRHSLETLAVSAEARRFAAKTARSISEIQQSVNNMADVLVFLEVLGYDEELVKRNGFESMRQLARYVYEFVDAFDEGESAATLAVQVPTTGRRIAEALSMVFPWVGALALLFISGVSLWMAWGLPREVTTLFLAGVFLGLVITEGFSQ